MASFESSSFLLTIIAALCFGWAILTRPFLVLAMPLLFLLVVWRERKTPMRAAVHGLLLTLGCMIVVAPWTLRNYRVFGKPVFIATSGGATFYGGNNDVVLHEPKHWGGWVSSGVLPGRNLIDAQPDEVSHDAMELNLGIGWVKTHLAWMPLLEAYKFVRFQSSRILGRRIKSTCSLQVIAYTPYLFLLLVAVARTIAKPRWDAGWLAVDALMLACIVTALIFWGSPRFRDSNTPLLMLYATLGLPAIPRRWLFLA